MKHDWQANSFSDIRCKKCGMQEDGGSEECPETLIILRQGPKPDMVNHPPHYKVGGIETIDFIEAKQLDFHAGNVVKYVARAKHKGKELEDLKKARWYLDRLIDKIEADGSTQAQEER